MMWLGWDTLRDDWIRTLGTHEFELFCRALVEAEYVARWNPDALNVEGPPPEGQPDGGVDLRVEVRAAPVVSQSEWVARTRGPRTLLGDASAGETILVSCKAGAGWQSDARDDATHGGERVLPVLRGGGRLVLLLSHFCPAAPAKKPVAKSAKKAAAKAVAPTTDAVDPVAEKTRVRRDLATRYAARLGVAVDAVLPRIDLLDGRDLAAYVRALRSPSLGERWGERAGVRAFPSWLSYGAWRSTRDQRPQTTWSDDATRAQALDQLVEFLAAGARAPSSAVICVIGRPGIGKTRFVEQAIERAGRASLAVVSSDPTAAAQSLQDGVFQCAPGALFVVDDCSDTDVERLGRRFLVAATERAQDDCVARLVLVCPTGSRLAPSELGCDVIRLDPLSEEASYGVIRAMGERTPDELRRIHALTQGYPWFAILVAQESRGDLPTSTRDAACRAIAPGASAATVRQRARALLAVMLTHGVAWNEFDDAARDRLARAVGLRDGDALEQQLDACEQRGIVRSASKRYVTPFVLEREVWLLLDDGGPDRPIRKVILEHAPERVARLVERLRDAGVHVDALSALAGEVCAALFSADRDADAWERSPLWNALRACAEVAPAVTLECVSSWIARTPLDALRAHRRVRRPLVASLRQSVRLGIAFATVEAALFRLMLAENEVYTDRATAVWAGLFLPGEWSGAESHEERIAVASQRCLTGVSSERVVAVSGLVVLSSQWSMEGASTESSLRDATTRAGYRVLWALLLRCAVDEAAEVATIARTRVAQHLQTAVEAGLLEGLDDALVAVLRALPEDERLKVRQVVDAEGRQSARAGRASASLWSLIDRETRGRSYGERLRERANAWWSDGAGWGEAGLREAEALVREGLVEPAVMLRDHLADLEGGASTAHLMAVAGRLDVSCTLRDALVERARDSTRETLLAFYCVGQVDAGHLARVRAWVDAWADDATLSRAVVETVVRVGPDDTWLELLEGLLRRGALHATSLMALTWGRWERVTDAARARFLGVLAESDHPDAATVVIDRLAEGDATLSAGEADALARALAKVAPQIDAGRSTWEFVRAAERLLACGRARDVAPAALVAAVQDQLLRRELWDLFAACATHDPVAVWEALAPSLAVPGAARDRLRDTLGWHDVLGRLPVERVMAWVEGDPQRASYAAWMLSLAGDDLPALAEALVLRFGARARVAERLTERLIEPPGDVRDFTAFYQRTKDRAVRWSAGRDGAVRAWLDDAIARLDRALRERRAVDAQRHRRAG